MPGKRHLDGIQRRRQDIGVSGMQVTFVSENVMIQYLSADNIEFVMKRDQFAESSWNPPVHNGTNLLNR